MGRIRAPYADHRFMAHKLDNYLRTYRRRVGLSQKEVAFLLGCDGHSKTSRYEQLERTPNLEAALAYEAVFAVPVKELFAGIYEKVEKKVLRRAGDLKTVVGRTRPTRLTAGKLAALKAIAGSRTGDQTEGDGEE